MIVAVEGIYNGNSPFVKKANSHGDDIAQLQRQKEIIQKQLEAVKSKKKNSQAEQDDAIKQIERLKKKIAEIDQKIQRLSQDQQQGQNASGTSAVNQEKERHYPKAISSLSGAQNKQDVLYNKQQDGTQKKVSGNKLKTINKMIDTYI